MSTQKGKYYLFANWKMYLDWEESQKLAKNIAQAKFDSQKINMVVFPSMLALHEVKENLVEKIKVGSQNVYWVDKGGYTGEVSATMAKSVGCEYVLVGHSERRHVFGETDHEVRQKMEAVLATRLTPVLCVGETAEERKQEKTREVLETQIRAALDGLTWPDNTELIVAYEPVWAISKGGVGEACDPTQAETTHVYIMELIKKIFPDIIPVLLYGGSARPDNIVEFLSKEHVNGALVGAASVKYDSWMELISLAQQSSPRG